MINGQATRPEPAWHSVRYRAIATKPERLNVACALVNLFMLRKALLRAT
ncbi:MAG: hypothetical protein SGI92_24935 [Bryobacteraceae bacterium]|nr:hypothetical protein [Bryobacteraceae bacterium]